MSIITPDFLLAHNFNRSDYGGWELFYDHSGVADARWLRWNDGRVFVGDSTALDPDGPEVQDSLLRDGVTTQAELLKVIDELQQSAANHAEFRQKG
ncbi:hypothetical protein NA78x_003482 [Anatilimnocola sp. NA78]|uniref:hypothetical protein n=1 Tax=Anatilimnocola sp. NA78 TaxID=3415683 RepID=UPI003CE58742